MSSDIQIANLALSHLGQDPTDTLDPNKARAAVRKLLPVLPAARDKVLTQHDYLEATEALQLQPLSVMGYSSWRYAYALPVDYIRPYKGAMKTDGRWSLGVYTKPDGNRIKVFYSECLIEEASVVVRLDYDLLSPQLALLVSLEAADIACVNITGKADLQKNIRERIGIEFGTAVNVDAFSGSHDESPFQALEDVRRRAI
jgi:hypothetical protein